MKPILSFLFLLTESQFVIEPEDITAGQNDPAILICAGRDGGKLNYLFLIEGHCQDKKRNIEKGREKRLFSIILIELGHTHAHTHTKTLQSGHHKGLNMALPAKSMRENLFTIFVLVSNSILRIFVCLVSWLRGLTPEM